MARPTKEQQEAKRRAMLAEEGKGPDGEPVEEATIISETKKPPVQKQQTVQAEFSVDELEDDLNNANMGNYSEKNEKSGMDMNNSDFSQGDKSDPNHTPMDSFNPFAEPLIQNESDANKAATGSTRINSGGGANIPPPIEKDFAEPIIEGGAPIEDEAKKKDQKPLNPGLDDLSPTERRKQTEMFADSILTTYAQLLPIIPTMICSYNMGKIDLLDKEGVIRLSMVVDKRENGDLTIREVFKDFNEEVSKVFVVTEEMKLELREPLIAVLMEKGIAPTPMVSLLIGIGRHILMFGIATSQLLAEKKSQLETFKQFRKQEQENERNGHVRKQHTPGPAPKTKETKQEVSMDDVINKKEEQPVTVKATGSEQKGITIEEVME